jgi:hypothetical protein
MNTDIEFLKYPIGKFQLTESLDSSSVKYAIDVIRNFPQLIFSVVSPLSIQELDTPYRPGGWTVRQLIHHCADSHINAYIRFKLALTEENPVIKPYDEAAWANLQDAKLPIESSLQIIKAVHLKWTVLLESMKPEDFERTYYHPEKKKSQNLAEVTQLYSWHSQHHFAHVQHLILRNFDR